ncbi:hypothetical protein EJB05_01839, partial [Eragrostis curvula]
MGVATPLIKQPKAKLALQHGTASMDTAQEPPVDPRADARVKLVLLWAAAIGVALSLYVCAGYVWASAATAVLLAAMCWFTWRFLCRPLEAAALARRTSMPYYRRSSIAGRRRRRSSARCASAPCGTGRRSGGCRRAGTRSTRRACVDGWLRKRATCPMCRYEVKVFVVAGAEMGVLGLWPQVATPHKAMHVLG